MRKLNLADLRSLPSVLEEWLMLKEFAIDNGEDFTSEEEMEEQRQWVEDLTKDIEEYVKEEYKQ